MAMHWSRGARRELAIADRFVVPRFGRYFILGISLGGDKKKEKSNTDAVRTDRTATSQRGTTSGTTKTKLLEDPIRVAANKLVTNLIKDAGGKNANKIDIDRLARVLETRAMSAEADQLSANEAALAQAERAGEKTLSRLETDLAAGVGGSKRNSFVAGATAEARVDLETNLAALRADLDIKARNLGTTEMNNAVEAFSKASVAGATDANAIAQMVGQLRGANATSTTNEKQSVDINEVLNSLIRQETVGKASSQDSIWSAIGKIV